MHCGARVEQAEAARYRRRRHGPSRAGHAPPAMQGTPLGRVKCRHVGHTPFQRCSSECQHKKEGRSESGRPFPGRRGNAGQANTDETGANACPIAAQGRSVSVCRGPARPFASAPRCIPIARVWPHRQYPIGRPWHGIAVVLQSVMEDASLRRHAGVCVTQNHQRASKESPQCGHGARCSALRCGGAMPSPRAWAVHDVPLVPVLRRTVLVLLHGPRCMFVPVPLEPTRVCVVWVRARTRGQGEDEE